MKPRIRIAAITTAIAITTAGAVGATAASAAPRKVVTATAVTVISNHPDGGNHDNPSPGKNTTWADDNFTRTATVTLVGEVSRSNCPVTGTGHCYLWDARITDRGTFTVNPTATSGAHSPGAQGAVLYRAVTGSFAGGSQDIQFYSSWKTPAASFVPSKQDDKGVSPTGRHTTTNWPEQFFGSGAAFNSAANPGGPDLGDWSWIYTANFGADPACPNDAYRWVDAANNSGGSLNTDGDILAPDAARCT
jgi:hypothetical protein